MLKHEACFKQLKMARLFSWKGRTHEKLLTCRAREYPWLQQSPPPSPHRPQGQEEPHLLMLTGRIFEQSTRGSSWPQNVFYLYSTVYSYAVTMCTVTLTCCYWCYWCVVMFTRRVEACSQISTAAQHLTSGLLIESLVGVHVKQRFLVTWCINSTRYTKCVGLVRNTINGILINQVIENTKICLISRS